MKHLLAFSWALIVIACQPDHPDQEKGSFDILSYVDPFIGTADHGHVYPGPTYPFGMVQLSPDNGTAGWDWCSGYNWADSLIVGFSHTHLSGTGIGDLLDISVMPSIQSIDFSTSTEPRKSAYAASFDHANETASPGFYAVKLDNGIQVELTAGQRTGFHKYTFPTGSQPSLLIDLGFAINWDRPTDVGFNFISDSKITGHRKSTGWAKDQHVYFAMEFSHPCKPEIAVADSTTKQEAKIGTPITGKKLRTLLFFDAQTIEVRVGISSANIEGAMAALDAVQNESFASIKSQTEEAWRSELSKIRITSENEADKRTFYTSLYRTCLAPVLFSDQNGNYKGVNGKVVNAKTSNRYCIFSLWDTFRAAMPLYTITQPERVNDFIRSMLAHYDEYALLPVWSLHGNETNTMTGYHAIPPIADAYFKGYRDYDVQKAYTAMKASAMQDIRATDHYREYGFIPYDKAGQSVTRTLEYAYDDWCIAQMAKALDKQADFDLFMQRSRSYRPVFDAKTGFMRAKMADGSWKVPFDPQYSSHDFAIAEYTEGNAWQHSWFVPHAVEDLIALHGGNEKFITKLDSLFSISSEIRGDNASVDISGLIGQYAHGNEPSHHIAYLYNFADAHYKTQERVRHIMTSQYNDTPHGLCGNEDCGQMSAWYVFSALGMYPVNPADGKYHFGSPIFDEAEIMHHNGSSFKVIAHNNSAENKYVERILLNGEEYDGDFLAHTDLMDGGTLEFYMTSDYR